METLRARSRVLRILVTMVFAILALVLALELRLALTLAESPWQLIIYRLPMLFYLWAIWSARRAIAAVERGEMFDLLVPALLTRIGVALFAGGLVNVFVSPLLARAVSGRGSFAYYDVAAITLAVVGLTLVIVARLLAEAAAMRRELDEFL